MAQIPSSSSSISLDQFYTRPVTAEACLKLLAERLPGFIPDTYVEPSAGDGVFLDRLPVPRFGMDIAPAAPGIETGDFLGWAPHEDCKTIAVVGNPPFGKNGSKAIAFFNHSATFATVIAMIMPASMRKGSMQDRLDDRFVLVDEMPLLAEPFRVGQTLCKVNAVFQIWRCGNGRRPKSIRKTAHADFCFVATAAEADFVVRRVGGRAGAMLPLPEGAGSERGYSPSSNLFIRAEGIPPELLEARFRMLDFREVRECVAANPSVSKSDIVALYEAQLDLERLSKASTEDDIPVKMRFASPRFEEPSLAQECDPVAIVVRHQGNETDQTAPPEDVSIP